MKAICVDNKGAESLLNVGQIYEGKITKDRIKCDERFQVIRGNNTVNYFSYRFKPVENENSDMSVIFDKFCDICANHAYVPKNIYYREQQGVTVVEWLDGTKTIVKTHGDDFLPEFGVAMALVKKVYGNRSDFMRIVNSGKFQKEEIKKKVSVKEKLRKQKKIAKKIQNDLKELNALEKETEE